MTSLSSCSTAWSSQPYSMGSYTSIGVGGQQGSIEKMAEPLFQRPQNRTVSEISLSAALQPNILLSHLPRGPNSTGPRGWMEEAAISNPPPLSTLVHIFPACGCLRRRTLSPFLLLDGPRRLLVGPFCRPVLHGGSQRRSYG